MRRRSIVCAAVLLLAIGYGLSAAPALAQLNTGLDFGTATGLSTQDIRVTVAKIIRAFLGLLGIMAVAITAYGGFLWMTSGGNEEQLGNAKQWLTNGAIGLTIILLSFSITQFVLSRLIAATLGSGIVTIATEGDGGGFLPPGALPGGCTDPGGTTPYICVVSPTRAGVGAYLTVRGYRFGAYDATASSVRIGGTAAPIIGCQGSPNWSEYTVVVEIPGVDVGRDYPITLTRADGVANANAVTVGVAGDASGPQVACVRPTEGPAATAVAIEGKQFGVGGDDARVTFGGGARAITTAWADRAIATSVPSGAQSGDLVVAVGSRQSNGYPFTVTCGSSADCGGGTCVQGQCVAGVGGGEGQSCDTDAATAACEPGACTSGLRCNAATCTCDAGPIITSVSPTSVVDAETGATYRRSEDVPAGATTVTAPNGAPGNLLTIRGRGFGLEPGTVTFLGGEGAGDDRAAALATCATAWSDTQVIVVVPTGAAIGPMRLETADQFADTTEDARGAAIEHFRPNAVVRPGVCSVTPPEGGIGAAVVIAGMQFGASRGAEDGVRFGDLAASASAWGASQITAAVPAIAEGAVDVRVRVGGEHSNAVTFRRAREVRVPRIREVAPVSGGPGQYVTIVGERFGSAIGRVTFTRGTEEFTVTPRFPDACRQDWWRDDAVTVRIPAAREEWGPPTPAEPFTAAGAYAVRVYARDGTELRPSENTVVFTVTDAAPTPGICAITPVSGPARTAVTIVGERFGDTEGVVRFAENQVVGANDKRADGADAFRWIASEVRGILVPSAARTGIVQLWRAGDATTDATKASNPVPFEVRDCRRGGASACTNGQLCCGDGTCVASGQRCGVAATAGSYQWTFSTGVIPKVPRVVESCDAFSPSPWDQQGAGASACVNANVRVAFTQSMDLGDLTDQNGAIIRSGGQRAADGVQVFQCVSGINVTAAAGAFEGGALEGWAVPLAPASAPLESAYAIASREEADVDGVAHGGRGMLKLEKDVPRAANPQTVRAQVVGIPGDATVDRAAFAVTAPTGLITDTDGTSYTARVFVKGTNPNGNPNRRAGILIARDGGPAPTRPGWWQQATNEVTLNGEWQELAVSLTFDRGENARDGSGPRPGIVRLYLTSPEPDAEAVDDDAYLAFFDDLVVTRAGDPCAERVPVGGTDVGVSSSTITFTPPDGAWEPGTWYEVIVAGDDGAVGTDADGSDILLTALMSAAGDPKLRLDGDEDGTEGGNYRFRFRTRESADACEIREVRTTPTAATATQRAPSAPSELESTADHPGLIHLRADGVGDPRSCFMLSTVGQAFTWGTATQPESPYVAVDATGGRWCVRAEDCAVVTCRTDADCSSGTCDTSRRQCVGTTFCSAERRCAYIANGSANRFAYTASARGLRETPLPTVEDPGTVKVRATLTAATPRTGSSDIAVRFEKPRVIAAWPMPACQAACPNGQIVAQFNVDLAATSVTAAASGVTGSAALYRCATESCARTGLVIQDISSVNPCNARTTCTGGVGVESQVVVVPASARAQNASYRVVLTNGITSAWDVPLEGLNYDADGDGVNDAYSWTFRTKSDPCGIARVEVTPQTVLLRAIEERASVTATPFSTPDQCAPDGQPIDAAGWDWFARKGDGVTASADVVGFTAVAPGGGFTSAAQAGNATVTRTVRTPTAACTLRCVRPGAPRFPGICGNGILETPGEECEREKEGDDGARVSAPDGEFSTWCDAKSCLQKGTSAGAGGLCGNGDLDDGEECDRLGDDGEWSVDGVFPAWCDATSCLRKGAINGVSICGNGAPPGDGEDCDDGNTNNGDGCSSRCVNEGTPPLRSPQFPQGIVAACGDGEIGPGEECDRGPRHTGETEAQEHARWASDRCDYDRCVKTGAPPITEMGGTCGNGTINTGEQCDDGAVGVCSAASPLALRYTACRAHADCGIGGTCAALRPVSGDGCSDRCLLEGSSPWWRDAVTDIPEPAMCGDLHVPSYRDGVATGGEACELTGTPQIAATQLIEARGTTVADADGFQRATIVADASGTAATGRANILLQCGYRTEDKCNLTATITETSHGLTRAGCCAPRPDVRTDGWAPTGNGVCRNARITVRFSQALDASSVGVQSDLGSGIAVIRGAVLERRVMSGSSKGEGEIEPTAEWEVVPTAVPAVTSASVDEEGRPVSDAITFRLTSPLAATTMYRIRVFGRNADTGGLEQSVRSIDGVRLNTTEEHTFSTGLDVCTIASVRVMPSQFLLHTRGAQAPLSATAYARGGTTLEEIVPVSGYQWTYAWRSTESAIAVPVATACIAGSATCAFTHGDPVANGEARAEAIATVTENALGSTGQTHVGSARLRVFLCTNPWPDVANPTTWNPYPRPGVCSNDAELGCAINADCGSGNTCQGGDANSDLSAEHVQFAYCRDAGDSATTNDDLPTIALTDDGIVAKPYAPSDATDPRELRKEFFLLPREVSYCSGSGDRCDEALAGECPIGEFCRVGTDAVGIRVYENARHESAESWFRGSGFTERATPVAVDGYRGIQSGRSTYLNVANLGSVFTNLFVFSVNDRAVPETQSILQQILGTVTFNTDLAEQNTRRCTDDASVRCTSDLDCGAADAGACDAPKDKLARDVRRAEDLVAISDALATYQERNRTCSLSNAPCSGDGQGSCPFGEQCTASVPALAGGTYIPGMTTSRWPSWAQELGSALGAILPVDPLNAFGGACGASEDQYDVTTCWSEKLKTYARPLGSYVYEYVRSPAGQAEVRAGFEYVDGTGGRSWSPAIVPPTGTGMTIPATSLAASAQVYGAGTARCGDGVEQISDGEPCDPPGKSETLAGSCTVRKCNGVGALCNTNADCPSGQTCQATAVTTGVQSQTCTQSCQWQVGFCTTQCGNGVVDAGEECDAGTGGGRVRPFTGVLPGVTPGTSYACSPSCTWTGGLCGDGVTQGAYGEQCDLGTATSVAGMTAAQAAQANVARTPAESAPTRQYGCHSKTAALACQRTDGYCGDSIIHDGVIGEGHGPNYGERCDGDATRSCVVGASVVMDSFRKLVGSPRENGESWWGASASGAGGATPVLDAPWTTYWNSGWKYNLQLQSSGDVRLTLTTSNDHDDLSSLTRDAIEAALPSGRTMSDYNPGGGEGAIGIFHRIRVRYAKASGGVVQETVWARATAPDQPQTTTLVLQGIRQGIRQAGHILVLWDNDWEGGAGKSSNLRVHRVTFEAVQALTCGRPGTANACQEVSWSTCRAAAARCGNGTVDDGEECDDGGAGRCSNDVLRVCRTDDECNAAGQSGNTCDRDADACTSSCRRNTCGDAAQLVPTCIAGDPARIGKPCTTASDCGIGGVCGQEACDLGVGNWRAACVGTPFTSDQQCVPNAVCPYGRTCNYCLERTCTVATKRGGYCGDGIVQGPSTTPQGPEQCDFIAGTNQSTAITRRDQLDWRKEVCAVGCDAKCPPTYTDQRVSFSQHPATDTARSYAVLGPGEATKVRVPNCRLLGGLATDVTLGSGVDLWEGPIGVVVVVDRSGSMYYTSDGNTALMPEDCGGPSTSTTSPITPDGDKNAYDDRIRCAVRALYGLFVELHVVSTSVTGKPVRMDLVSFGNEAKWDSDLGRPTGDSIVPYLQSRALEYLSSGDPLTENPGGTRHPHGECPHADSAQQARNNCRGKTRINLAIEEATRVLNGPRHADDKTKVIILLSDGEPTDRQAAIDAANAFKAQPNSYIFTIAFPVPIATMTELASGTHPAEKWDFAFGGRNLDAIFSTIANAIQGVTLELSRNGITEDTVVAVTRAGLSLETGPFAEACASGGRLTEITLTAKFRRRPGSQPEDQVVRLEGPTAQVCVGPPWPP